MAMTTFEKAREDWEPFSIYRSGGRIFHGYVSDIRIDRKTVPDGWYVYDMREWEGPDGISAYNIFRQKAHGFNRGMNATCM